VIVTLFTVTLPAIPAQANYDLLISPSQGSIGDTITITGSNFPPTTNPLNPQVIWIYFSNEQVSKFKLIGTDLTNYQTISNPTTTSTGTFSTTFTIPDKLKDNSAVTTGTYYIYVCYQFSTMILNRVSLTVIGGDISIKPTQGVVDSQITITGDGFVDNSTISIMFGRQSVFIEEGDATTDSNGDFLSTIVVPTDRAGKHPITVDVADYTVESTFTIYPDIKISPQSGEYGTVISVNGTGFTTQPHTANIYFDTDLVATAYLGMKGNFRTSFNVPSGLKAGVYSVDVEDEDFNLATASFTLVVPTTQTIPTPPPTAIQPTTIPPHTTPPLTPNRGVLTVSQESENFGSSMILKGFDFTPNSILTISYNDKDITVETDENGMFLVNIELTNIVSGTHTISASDGKNVVENTFNVESLAPKRPDLDKPDDGANILFPFTFQWDEVSDNSLPVTYNLQVASNDIFTADSIILNKMGLNFSSYTLTEIDLSMFAEREIPYYWRVKAIDAVSNEGAWTIPSKFFYSGGSMSSPKSMVAWWFVGGGILAIIIISILIVIRHRKLKISQYKK